MLTNGGSESSHKFEVAARSEVQFCHLNSIQYKYWKEIVMKERRRMCEGDLKKSAGFRDRVKTAQKC